MAKKSPMMSGSMEPDYDHRISMRRKDGPMRMTQEMAMGKDRKQTEKIVKTMIDRMFASVKGSK